MEKIYLDKRDLDAINEIVKENNIEKFQLIYDEGGGIGYLLSLEYQTTIKKRDAVVRFPIVTVEDW